MAIKPLHVGLAVAGAVALGLGGFTAYGMLFSGSNEDNMTAVYYNMPLQDLVNRHAGVKRSYDETANLPGANPAAKRELEALMAAMEKAIEDRAAEEGVGEGEIEQWREAYLYEVEGNASNDR